MKYHHPAPGGNRAGARGCKTTFRLTTRHKPFLAEMLRPRRRESRRALPRGAESASDEPARSDRRRRPRGVHRLRRRPRRGPRRAIARLPRREDAQGVRRMEVRPLAPAVVIPSAASVGAQVRDVRAGARARHGRPTRANSGADRLRQRRGRLRFRTRQETRSTLPSSSSSSSSSPSVVAHLGGPGAVPRPRPRRADDSAYPHDARRGHPALREGAPREGGRTRRRRRARSRIVGLGIIVARGGC